MRVQGNTAFKSGDYVAAVGHYTDAALADRLEPTYPLNRAAAYLKLGKYATTHSSCDVLTFDAHTGTPTRNATARRRSR